jgi:hypothetical protein
MVLDWVEDWLGRQANPSDLEGLDEFEQIVSITGVEAAPFVKSFADGLSDSEILGFTQQHESLSPKGLQLAPIQAEFRHDEQPAPTPIEQACQAVFERRQRNAASQRFQRQCETGLRTIFGEMLNHRMVGCLSTVTAELGQFAREVYFRELHRKRSLSPSALEKAGAARERILAQLPFVQDDHHERPAIDRRWLRKMMYVFHRLVHLWLLRPLLCDDFMAVCHAEGMDLTGHGLDALRSAHVLNPLVPSCGLPIYHIAQVFALSCIWPEWSRLNRPRNDQLEATFNQAVESMWEDLAFLSPNRSRLNSNRWLTMTQEAREKRALIAKNPAQRLWIEGRGNLAAAFLWSSGIRPVAFAGRPRIAPDDIVLKVLEDIVLNYLQQEGTIRGCLSLIRKATLDEQKLDKILEFFRLHAPAVSNEIEKDDRFILSWREKLGAEKALDRALDELWATFDGVPDETQAPGDLFAFERMASQKCVPLAGNHSSPELQADDVLRYANGLAEGPADAVACWDTHRWGWWLVPRWIVRQPVGHWLLRHVRLPLTQVDATRALTASDECDVTPAECPPNFGN